MPQEEKIILEKLETIERTVVSGFEKAATKVELNELAQTVATKDDLKESIEGLARTTKEDIEGLAQMVARGFEEAATKKDIEGLAARVEKVEEDITVLRQDMESGFQEIIKTLKLIQQDIKELKGLEVEVTSLRLRMDRVEKHLGLLK